MPVLAILEFAVTVCIAGLFITQMMMPLIFGTRFFPAFRNTELKQKVDEIRNEVEDLKDQNTQLSELEKLLQQKHDLEVKIAQINNPEGTK
jgi:sensor histidine kinase YesM